MANLYHTLFENIKQELKINFLKDFDKNIGKALSIAYAGQGLGVLIMAPISQILIDNVGWQLSYEYISYIFVFLLIIASILPWNTISKGSKNNPRKTFNGKVEANDCAINIR